MRCVSRELLRIAAVVIVLAGTALAEAPWQPLFVKNGVVYDKRAVAGSKFFEYRAVFTVPRPPKAGIPAKRSQPDNPGDVTPNATAPA